MTDYWETHISRHNREDLSRIQSDYPRERLLTIDVSKISSNDVWKDTLDNPLHNIELIMDALRAKLPERSDRYRKVRVRFVKVSAKRKIKELRSRDEHQLISIKALVKRSSDIRPKVTEATFTCDAHHVTIVRPKNDMIPIPPGCATDGCTLRRMTHVDARDKKVDRQWIYIQDPLDDLTDGGQPAFLKCEVVEDLCGIVVAGDRVVLNGIYRSVPIIKQGGLTASKDVYFVVYGIEVDEREFEEVKITQEDEDAIRTLAAQPDVYSLLISSIAPSILGMPLMKRAIVLLLFEGVTRTLPDGVVQRGHINVLCVSDPGMAKTRLLRFVASIAPRGVFTNATTSTKVGLVAPIVRDETTGEYTVQAGAYMIASGGVLCLDEVSELSKEDFKYLNEAMEDGEAHITKGGLNITVKTRASLLAACNPFEGCFDPFRPLAEQVKIPESTLSRFDLKILLKDESSEDHDRELISHITDSHMETQDYSSFISPDLMRKYIAMGRGCKPVLTKESKKVIDDYYVRIRKEIGNGDTMKITPRQGTACIRLAEARARVRLSNEVSADDAREAVELFDACFRNVATDPVTGALDAGRIDHRAPRVTIMSALFHAIRDGGDGGASEDNILKTLHKFDQEKVKCLIKDLLKEGKLIEPKNGVYRMM